MSVTPPEGGDESLTLAESARLDRMDADIEAVIAREYEQSLPTTEVDLPRWSAPRYSCARPAIRSLWPSTSPGRCPVTPDAARRGTAFHEWVAASHEQLSLIPDWDLAVDAERAGDDELAELIEGYRRTVYCRDGSGAHTETEVSVRIAGLVVRRHRRRLPASRRDVGRRGLEDQPGADRRSGAAGHLPPGLGAARGVEPDEVLTAFVYVRDGEVVRPALPSIEDIASRVGAVSAVVSGGSQ